MVDTVHNLNMINVNFLIVDSVRPKRRNSFSIFICKTEKWINKETYENVARGEDADTYKYKGYLQKLLLAGNKSNVAWGEVAQQQEGLVQISRDELKEQARPWMRF
jgi:hypothetical protein